MKRAAFESRRIKDLVRIGSSLEPVPAGARDKVLARIREKTGAKPHPSIASILRYTPAYAAAALALIIALPLVIAISFRLLSGIGAEGTLVVFSDRGGTLEASRERLASGRSLSEGDVIVTSQAEQVSARSKEYYELHLFSRSSARIASFDRKSRAIEIGLRSGSLYANEYSIGKGERLFSVEAGEYRFVLVGTRVWFAVSGEGIIRIVCFDGGVEAYAKEKEGPRFIFGLAKGEKAELGPGGSYRLFRTLGLTREELDFDSELASTAAPARYYHELPWRPWQQDEGLQAGATEAPAESVRQSLPPYSVSVIGNIKPSQDGGEKAPFFAGAWMNGRLFLVNRESVFAFVDRSIVRVKGIPTGASFRARPLSASGLLCVPAATSLIFIDPVSLLAASEIQLPRDGAIDHGFGPLFYSGILYVPVQNYGYYTLDPGPGQSGLKLIESEPFPISPRRAGGHLYTGSYYGNYVKSFGESGDALWRISVAGGAFTNIETDASGVYVYSEGEGGPAITRYSHEGAESGRWPTPGGLRADYIVFDGKAAGITGEGLFFILDTSSGKITLTKKVISARLSAREWRTVIPLLSDGKLYVQSDSGSIFVVDPGPGAVEAEIRVNPDEAFYAPPFKADGILYCAGAAGNVYEVVKNER